jgi:thymidylate synthase (FAD)
MIKVEPKMFFLGQPRMHLGTDDDPGVTQWLRHIGGRDALECLQHVDGTDVERLIELLARRCYKSFAPGLNPNVKKIRTSSAAYHANIAEQRHGSVVADGGMVTYAFEDVSRVFTHEICRNRQGTEFAQESLRYVRLTDLRFWTPPIIADEVSTKTLPAPPLVKKYGHSEGTLANGAMHLCPADIFEMCVEMDEWAQRALAEYFVIDDEPSFARKKKLTSAFRRIAPIGLATGIGISFNLRALRCAPTSRRKRRSASYSAWWLRMPCAGGL